MKIAISGAGIAGTTLAYWLYHTGHEPVLIETSREFRTGGYIIDFWGTGYSVAERMGILPEVRKAGYSVNEVRFVNEKSQKVGGFKVDIFRKYTDDCFTSLPRGDLALAIYRTIETRVETVFDNGISQIEERADDVLVSFTGGPSRSFDLVVGADGLHSTVRRIAFGPEYRFEKELGYQVAAFEAEDYVPRDELAYVGYTLPGRQISRFALRNNKTMFLFLFDSAQARGMEASSTQRIKALLQMVYKDAGWECPQILQALDKSDNVYFDSVSQIHMPKWSHGRVLLVGDAAACVSLLAGEGAGLAMTEAYVLAGELNRLNGDYCEAFRDYERLLRPFVETKQQSANKFASAFVPKTRLGVWFRNHVTKLLAVPPFRYYFIGRDLYDDFDLPDYGIRPLGTP
jgi:2-polyprenyl-6-methoxyphenol hydroxylase-like FAD-dependent oxidoreductase